MVRDPLSRAISHYNHWKKNGFKKLQKYTLEDFLLGLAEEDWINKVSSNWMASVLNCNEDNYKEIRTNIFL